MEQKINKAQVVIATIDSRRQSYDFLLLQMNEKRGGFWQNVTGKIENGENFSEGALREAIEETGLQIENIVDIIDLDLSFNFVDQRKRHAHEECMLIILENKWDVLLDPSEHKNYKWVRLEDISSNIVEYKSNFQAIQKSKLILKKWGR